MRNSVNHVINSISLSYGFNNTYNSEQVTNCSEQPTLPTSTFLIELHKNAVKYRRMSCIEYF